MNFWEESEESQDEQLELNAEQTKGAVSFEHVRFGYHPDKIIIHDFSCEVDPGEMVAIVGPTGAGKTTMIKLLMRFYDVNQGAIKVDGNDIRQFKRGNLRENFWYGAAGYLVIPGDDYGKYPLRKTGRY